MKRLVMSGFALATALVPAHANDGPYLIEQMPIMDFYMQIVPPGWKALVENGDLPCQMLARTDPRSQSADEQRRDHLSRKQNVRGAADSQLTSFRVTELAKRK